jgi:hypothetical protein
MFRPNYKPRGIEDEFDRLREKYLRKKEDQVTDSIK